MKNIYDAIEVIRKRPGMYLGENSISKMETFLNGYHMAFSLNDVNGTGKSIIPLPFKFFDCYLKCKYKETGNMGWCHIILKHTDGNEEEGLRKFFQLIDGFKAVKLCQYSYAKLSNENIQFHNIEEEVPYYHLNPLNLNSRRIPIYKDAIGIYNIILENHIGCLFAVEYENAICIPEWYQMEEELLNHARSCFGKIKWGEFFKIDEINFSRPIYYSRWLKENGEKSFWMF